MCKDEEGDCFEVELGLASCLLFNSRGSAGAWIACLDDGDWQ